MFDDMNWAVADAMLRSAALNAAGAPHGRSQEMVEYSMLLAPAAQSVHAPGPATSNADTQNAAMQAAMETMATEIATMGVGGGGATGNAATAARMARMLSSLGGGEPPE